MTDWADEKAREWLKEMRLSPKYNLAPLAALLREVDRNARTPVSAWQDIGAFGQGIREQTLAEVRKIVEGRMAKYRRMSGINDQRVVLCSEILRRIEGGP